ncbi:trypsin-like [Venturia canescens]|uniref:trypsin-like n=1 Tax=Venturia canescens TaxID=32260 RepID=UPI001C9D45FE|nr:trypsin-like [Venturia canescens]
MIRSYTFVILCATAILGSGFQGNEGRKLSPRSISEPTDAEANIAEVPWQASLLSDWGNNRVSYTCGGSIISSHWVATAASCVCRGKKEPESWRLVSTGSSDYEKGSRHKVVQLICHPLYQIQSETHLIGVHDIALLRVEEPFVFDRTRQAIPLYNGTFETAAQLKANTSGWGGTVTQRHNKMDHELRFATMEIISKAEHDALTSKIYPKNPPTGQIWAKPLSGTVCYKDSGAPLTINGALVGIASWLSSDYCSTDNPVLYTEIASHRSWILENTLT